MFFCFLPFIHFPSSCALPQNVLQTPNFRARLRERRQLDILLNDFNKLEFKKTFHKAFGASPRSSLSSFHYSSVRHSLALFGEAVLLIFLPLLQSIYNLKIFLADSERNTILEALQIFEEHTCLRFHEIDKWGVIVFRKTKEPQYFITVFCYFSKIILMRRILSFQLSSTIR